MENVDQHFLLGLSGPALVLYVVAVALFVGIVSANLRVIEALTEGVKARKPAAAAAFALLITFVSNFIGAATIALLGKTSGAAPRMSMIAFPLLLVIERHARAAVKDAKDRTTHLCALLGSAGGVLAGAWFLLRGVVVEEQVKRSVVSGSVRTLTVEEAMAHPQDWQISAQLVVFYLLSLTIFWAAHWGLKLSSESMAKDLRDARAKALLTALVSALVLNFFGVGALVLIGQAAQVPVRIAMIIVPAFIVVESYATLLRSDRENRYGHWMGLIGSAAGMAGAAFLLLKGAPYY
jgi:fatty acid desaturase